MEPAPGPDKFHHAVVICTRNRPDDVRRLMESLSRQDCSSEFLVAVIDASDPGQARRVREAVESWPGLETRYVAYPHAPSLARQRNFGADLLPSSVQVVHFMDDDVTLEPGYLEVLTSILDNEPATGGAGGRVILPAAPRPRSGLRRLVARFFLLESATPGKVLASGGVTGAQSMPLAGRVEVQCLAGCSASYRRDLVVRLRFDDRLEGYSMDEDFDFSYRVGRIARLFVEPSARLIHHVSPTNRHSIRASRRDLVVYRYWFIEKNIKHPLKKPAFWWKVFGSFLMTTLSRNPDAREARKGIVDGVSIVLRRAHPLL